MSRTIPWQGKKHDVQPVAVEDQLEHWNDYRLADGSSLRVKVVVSEVLKLVNPLEFDAEGNPTYVVKWSNVVTVTSPDELRRPSQPA